MGEMQNEGLPSWRCERSLIFYPHLIRIDSALSLSVTSACNDLVSNGEERPFSHFQEECSLISTHISICAFEQSCQSNHLNVQEEKESKPKCFDYLEAIAELCIKST